MVIEAGSATRDEPAEQCRRGNTLVRNTFAAKTSIPHGTPLQGTGLFKPAIHRLRHLVQYLEEREGDPWPLRVCKRVFGGCCRLVLWFNPWLHWMLS